MFSRSLAKDVKSLKNQFLNISKIHPWHCGCISVSDKPCVVAVDRKTAIPAGRPSPWSSSCGTAESPKNCTDSWHFLKNMRSRGAVLNRIFLTVLYICSVPLNLVYFLQCRCIIYLCTQIIAISHDLTLVGEPPNNWPYFREIKVGEILQFDQIWVQTSIDCPVKTQHVLTR